LAEIVAVLVLTKGTGEDAGVVVKDVIRDAACALGDCSRAGGAGGSTDGADPVESDVVTGTVERTGGSRSEGVPRDTAQTVGGVGAVIALVDTGHAGGTGTVVGVGTGEQTGSGHEVGGR
jgi:hypothetical protein